VDCAILALLGAIFGGVLAYDFYIRRGEDDQ